MRVVRPGERRTAGRSPTLAKKASKEVAVAGGAAAIRSLQASTRAARSAARRWRWAVSSSWRALARAPRLLELLVALLFEERARATVGGAGERGRLGLEGGERGPEGHVGGGGAIGAVGDQEHADALVEGRARAKSRAAASCSWATSLLEPLRFRPMR